MKEITQNGRSMVEMLGVLAIIGVLSVGGFSLISKMQDSYAANQVIEQAGEIASRTRNVMRDFPNGSGSMNWYLRKAKAVPDAFLANNTSASSSMNSLEDVVFDVYYIGATNVTFSVVASGLSMDMCMQMVMTNWGGPGSSGFIGMAVSTSDSGETLAKKVSEAVSNGSASKTVALVGSSSYPAPMGIGTASDVCSQDGMNLSLSYR